MKEKDFKNLKNKIGLKNFLVSKNKSKFDSKNINIKTINIEKNYNYFNEDKNFFVEKNMNNIRYLNSINNYNIVTKNDFFHKKKKNSFLNSSDSEHTPSSISILGSSPYIPSSKKKLKKRRYHHNNIINKKNNKYINTNDSLIHNLSFNTNSNSNTNVNISYINSDSSSSEEDNEYTDLSEASYKSKENKRKKYLDKMLVEENDLDYLKKSEVGLYSSDEDDYNNSVENINNSIEENFNNEIERILIEIYNKNISLISSGNIYDINKNYGEVQDIERQIKKYLQRENLNTNLLVLKSLSNKIKELIGKYKEKVFEIEKIKLIRKDLHKRLFNEQILNYNNSLESNVATNYNSNESYNSGIDEENFIKKNLVLKREEELNKKGVSFILLKELINIQRTLKVSSKEIEGIFKYPLNILKNEEGKKLKFSVELMQREEFCKNILEDEIISNILIQIKEIFYRHKNQKITKWLLELEEAYQHKNEMTKFIKYINDLLPIRAINENENKIIDNNYFDELNIKDKIIENYNNITQGEISKKMKKKKNKKENNKINEKVEDEKKEEEIKFKDIDEILNYINDTTDTKKGKKKYKKNKKNKNKICNKEEEKEKDKEIEKEKQKETTIINNNEDNNNNNQDEFDIQFENFKNDLINNTVFVYEINEKIKPCLSENFLNSIS